MNTDIDKNATIWYNFYRIAAFAEIIQNGRH